MRKIYTQRVMKNFQLPRIYPLTDVQMSGLSHAEQIRMLRLGGASLIQLREKQATPWEFYEQAKTAVELARRIGVNVIVNDRADVALAAGAAGVHLGQNDMPPKAARKLLGDGAIIGFSTHNLEQAREALSLPVDYLAIGPIFETATKTDIYPALGVEGLRAVREAVGQVPLVAIGGISHANVLDVIAAGADSVAMISALLSRPGEIAEATKTLFHSLSKARST